MQDLKDYLSDNGINPTENFFKSAEQYTNFNGEKMAIAYYNVCIESRNLKLWESGMKPNRYWYVSDTKKYFGIKGNKSKLVSQIEFIRQALLLG
tara:strand:+ start:116 stop:397 length:282 start_codon:yes stop_codon:yes gene_type:complete